jgi:hypothetical protein
LLEFIGLINAYIGSEYSRYRSRYSSNLPHLQAKEEKIGKCNAKNLNLFLRVYSTLFEYKMTNIIIELDCQESLEWLMTMSRGRGGIVEGARLVFIRQKDIYILENTLLRDQNR